MDPVLQPQTEIIPQQPSSKKKFLFLLLLIIVLVPIALYSHAAFNKKEKETVPEKKTVQQQQIPTTFQHYTYLPKPSFSNTTSSSIAASSEYSLKNPLPSVEEVMQSSKKVGFLSQAFAQDASIVPLYTAKRHEMTIIDAKELATKFGYTSEPKKDGFTPPAYYEYVWEDANTYFLVTGGSGTGSFEYYIKKPLTTEKKQLSDDEIIQKAKTFLTEKGIVDNSYTVSGILGNVSDISKRSGYRHEHKQVYFRKKIQDFPVYNWIAGGGSPIADSIEVWVNEYGDVSYVFFDGFWTSVDTQSALSYTVKQPQAVYEEIKGGKGRIAWMDYDKIDISTGGYGPSAPSGNFALYGRLKDVIISDVKLAYYHERKGIEEIEYYQPVYLFTAEATLDWKESYVVDYEADKYIQGKRTDITLIAPAVLDSYYFDAPIAFAGSTEQPRPVVTKPPVITPTPIPTNSPTRSFVAKLGVIIPKDDPKRDVQISWSEVPGTVKYNVYLKLGSDTEYHPAVVVGTGELYTMLGINKYLDYFIKVDACNTDSCVSSNDVYIPQEQKVSFALKQGEVKATDEVKQEVVLTWDSVPVAVKYNVFLKHSPSENYGAAIAGIGDTTYTVTLNKNEENYVTVQACNVDICYTSNELLITK